MVASRGLRTYRKTAGTKLIKQNNAFMQAENKVFEANTKPNLLISNWKCICFLRSNGQTLITKKSKKNIENNGLLNTIEIFKTTQLK